MKFRKPLLIIFLLFINIAFAESEKPDVILYMRNPWLMVVGSDSPYFAAYKSGQIIWFDSSVQGDEGYKSVTLTQNEYAAFIEKIKTYSDLNENYVLSRGTDQPQVNFSFNINGVSKSVNVYGDLSSEANRDKAPKQSVNVSGFSGDISSFVHGDKAPKQLLELYDLLANYKNVNAKRWEPEAIEVMVWPYDYAPEESIIWPQGWPDLQSKSTKKRKMIYSIFVPIEHKDALYKFISSKKERGAVEINGKKWAVSTRIPFPHEFD